MLSKKELKEKALEYAKENHANNVDYYEGAISKDAKQFHTNLHYNITEIFFAFKNVLFRTQKPLFKNSEPVLDIWEEVINELKQVKKNK